MACFGNYADAQTDYDLSEFKFSIEIRVDYVRLVSTKGCDFNMLGFSLKVGDTQAVNKSGMTCLDDTTTEDSFLFTITRTEEGSFILKGIKGTAWKELSFTCAGNCRPIIDQNGVSLIR